MIDGLDHMTIVTADLAASRHFYGEVLGLVDGERPPFDVPGAWLYQGDRPIVHLVGREAGDQGGSTGPFDHLAFRASDLAGTVARLDRTTSPTSCAPCPASACARSSCTTPTASRSSSTSPPASGLPGDG